MRGDGWLKRGGWCALAMLGLGAAAAPAAELAAGQMHGYPNRPIRIIVLNSAGSGSDTLSRTVGAKLTEALGQPVVIDNRPGAGGNIGLEIGARAAPDGYTLIMITSQQPIVVAMYEKLNYDLIRDFAPISLIGSTPLVLAAHPSVAAGSVKELIALARAKPGQLNYGSPGSGSSGHLAAEVFKSLAGINMTHVPYKGAGPALTDTMSGQVQLSMLVAPIALPVIKSGKLRGLGTTARQRSPLAPDMPTVAETLPGYEWSGWYGLVAPAGTPRELIALLNRVQVNAIRGDFQKRLLELGVVPVGSTPQEYAGFMRAEVDKMRFAIKMSGARPD